MMTPTSTHHTPHPALLLRLLAALLLLLTAVPAAAQNIVVRYVSTDPVKAAFSHGGTSWDDAKNNLQSAIDEAYEEIRSDETKVGYIFVAQGTYEPTRRATDDADGSLFNTAFRIPERIYVFGGFYGDETAANASDMPGTRKMENDMTLKEDEELIDRDDIDNSVRRWNFKYKSVLTGNHSMVSSTFRYDKTRGRYTTTFPLNSYHVVWFATNGEIEIDAADYPTLSADDIKKLRGHYRGLDHEACVDGFTIREGNASSRDYDTHDHTGYGGGVYMVRNAVLRNCIIENCSASMRGGGVYMDGGGEMERCYVHTSQATGVGVVQGYGGAVCIDYDGAVKHSHIIQSAARIGAGLAICHVPGEYPEASARLQDESFTAAYKAELDKGGTGASTYDPYCVATVIANCTSMAEGGGVYLDEGGTLNHCTVVRNTCIGPDVVYYGRRHGRTGGIYVRSAGTIYNSVAWGNTSPVNNDVQFASFRESNALSTDKIAIYHSAFSNHDITNWANAQKSEVVSLSNYNVPTVSGQVGNFPAFLNVTEQAGIQYDDATLAVDPDATGPTKAYQKVYNWHPQAVSALRLKAVQVSDAVQGISQEVIHAHTEVDVVGRPFEAVSSIGALAHSYRTIHYALVKSQEQGESVKQWPTIFVDPGRTVSNEATTPVGSPSGTVGYADADPVGQSWDRPAGNLPDAIMFFKKYQQADGSYSIPDDPDNPEGPATAYQHVQILVKTGTLTVAGTGSYLENSVRTASIRPVSNMRLYGGFGADFTGTKTDGRNQRKSPTRITANVINGGYDNNSAHVFSLVNCRNVIIDGFRIYYGNANLTHDESVNTGVISYGGGVMVSNYNADLDKRIDMTGNILRNCVIANCSAPEGGAVYVNGQYEKANGNLTHAELSIVNTIIRNSSTASGSIGDETYAGVVVANGNAVIHMDHCDILNNKGYPLETRSVSGTVAEGEFNEGRIDIHNSIIYANARTTEDNRNVLGKDADHRPLIYKSASGTGTLSNGQYPITGTYVYTDALATGDNQNTYWPKGFGTYATDPTTTTATHCYAFLRYDPADDKNYPRFKNPSRNIGHNEDADKPLYGGTVDYEPMNMNPIVNAAGPAVPTSANFTVATTSPDLDAGSQPRTRGGAPDLGAIEDSDLPEKGTVKYVRRPQDGGDDSYDGDSWATAYATINHAISQCQENKGMEIWVAAGKYEEWRNRKDPATGTLESDMDTSDRDVVIMKQGVSMYGGFVRHGNPGKSLRDGERNIGNSELYDGETDEDATKYQTIIDGGGKGRVLSMHDNFPVETVVEGFTLQNASTPRENVTSELSMWKATTVVEREYSFDWEADGWESYDGIDSDHYEMTASDPYTSQEELPDGTVSDNNGHIEETESTSSDYTRREEIESTREDYDHGKDPVNVLSTDVYDYIDGNGKTSTNQSTFKSNVTTNDARRAANSEANRSSNNYWGENPSLYTTNTTAGNYADYYTTPEFISQNVFQNAITAADNRQSANSPETARKYGNYYYYGTGATTSGATNSNYDYYTGWLSKTYYKYTNYYRVQWYKYNNYYYYRNGTGYYKYTSYYKWKYYKSTYYKWHYYGTRYYRDVSKTAYVLDTEGYPSQYYSTIKKSNTAGYEFTNIGFPREGQDYCDGAGARLYANGVIKNCLIWKNKISTGTHVTFAAGAAMLKGSRMESCIVRNNVVENRSTSSSKFNGITRGVGVHAATAVIVNSLIVENVGINGFSFRGIGLYTSAKSEFYQCTIAYNFGIIGNPSHVNEYNGSGGTVAARINMYIAPGVSDDTQRNVAWSNVKPEDASQFYNCIVWGNAALAKTATSYAPFHLGYGGYTTNWDFGGNKNSVGLTGMFHNCYMSAPNEDIANATGTENLYNTNSVSGIPDSDDDTYKYEAIHSYWKTCQNKNLFNESKEGYAFDPFLTTKNNLTNNNVNNADDDYTPDNIIARASKNPYNINDISDLAEYNINRGDGAYSDVLNDNWKITIDINGADRVQDCQVDKGAYEYDGTKDIKPKLFKDKKQAVFYISHTGGGGLASGDSPGNAACLSKLQKVIDAAGRWKYAARYYMNTDDTKKSTNGYHYNWTNYDADKLTQQINDGEGSATITLADLKDFTVIVKMAGDYTYPKTGFKYSPTRSTETNENAAEENILERSFIVPRGVYLMGGYDNTFSDDTRDPLGNPTRLGGVVTNATTGTNGNVFHVVTFTENLFDTNGKLYTDDNGEQVTGQLSVFTGEENRAVLDGLFLQDGYASGTDADNRRGAAAVVTDYAHVRNCVVTDNEAVLQGGGLYLKHGALVSGSIIKNNTAQQGGGLYVEGWNTGDVEADVPNVHLYTTTVINNRATSTGGGLYYTADAPNVLVNSSVFWHNEANDLANVAGNLEAQTPVKSDTGGSEPANYPFNYSGIESRRVPGVNNLQLPVSDGEGVRWNHSDRYEDGSYTGDILYVPITLSSVLARAGMTYDAYNAAQSTFKTLADEDIVRLRRTEQAADDVITLAKTAHDPNTAFTRVAKDNAFIDMGARVLNKSFSVEVDEAYVMHRLFVAKTENLPEPEALARLQENENTDATSKMYRQMGSTFANPFHRLGDAFDYIAAVRKKDAEQSKQRFEVFVSEGEFYPFRDAYGEQGNARTNTFVIPEGVTVVGGVDVTASGHQYCQEKESTTVTVNIHSGGSITLNGAPTQTIRNARERYDYNGNNVFEPWELKTLSKLMGNAVDANSEGTTNVYHVVTCMADPSMTGPLPPMYSDDACTTNVSDLEDLTDKTTDQKQTALLAHIKKESQASRDRRTIILDGLQITGGHANDIQPANAILSDDMTQETGETIEAFTTRKGHQNATQLTYFRGGGILVEGNWDQEFLTQGTLPEVLGVAKRDIPLMVVNCEFQNNQAGNGGAIYSNGTLYVTGSHFTQNLAMGPQTENDQLFIPWTAGGAIATNYGCNVFNSLFDNNEARRGNYKILSEADNSRNTSGITNADARQGSGGVISSSETSVVRMANCNLVMNKALQFPAIYNFYDNELRNQNTARYGEGRHYAVNTIFWGNTVPTEYEDVPMALADEGTRPATVLRKRYHVANFGPHLDQEVCYFSAYEEGKGRTPTLPANTADRETQKMTTVSDLNELKDGSFFNTYFTTYNNNQLLNSVNTAADGPYFMQPSTIPGADGYMQNADWLVARLNAIIDNGWSYLEQKVTQKNLASPLLTTHFCKKDPATGTFDDDDAGNSDPDNLKGAGFYNAFSHDVYMRFKDVGFSDLMPIADEDYIEYTRETETNSRNMRRISTHPKIGQQKVFIDIGIYEYQYIQLTSQGSETDVIWVGPTKRGDGQTAATCTDNLQEAIEMLLLSRNGHDKMIKIIGGTKGAPAEYSPMSTTESNKLAFFVKVPEDDTGVTNPSTKADEALSIKSLTIRGGYSASTPANSDGESLRDIELHPVVLKMSKLSGYDNEQFEHLFLIENAQQKETWGSFISNRQSKFVNEAMPIVLDGITFENAYATKGTADLEKGAAVHYEIQNYKTDKDASADGLLKPAQELKRDEDDKRVVATDASGNPILLPKLTIKDCAFVGNATDKDVPAVVINEGGGEAIVANSLFHSNAGAPLYAINTKVVNCTFAKNGGHLTLANKTEGYTGSASADFPSELHNSIIWQDNGGSGTQYEGVTSGTKMTHNAIMGYTNEDEDQDNQNINLSTDNSDVFLGPNFADPDNADVSQRDFHVNISNRIINRASTEKYIELVPYYETYLYAAGATEPNYKYNNRDDWFTGEGKTGLYSVERDIMDGETKIGSYTFQSVQRGMKSTLTNDLLRKRDSKDYNYTEVELASVPRLLGGGMERGAYESEATLQRIIYVTPEGGATDKDGTEWAQAYAQSNLQNAINVASIYSMTNAGKRGYVFVKGNDAPLPAVKLRDGVSVYGSVRQGFYGEAILDAVPDGEMFTDYSDEEVARYVREVKADRNGIATRGATVSTLSGISSDGSNNGAAFEEGFLLDGFWLKAGAVDGTPILLDRDKVVLRNCIITGNTASTSGQPVVNLQKGLLYNTLVYDNSASPLIQVGAEGYVLNTTVTTASGQTALTGETGTGHVQNCIVASADASMFAPYLRTAANAYTPTTTLTAHRPYWYQLHEQSQQINGGTDNGSGKDGDNTIAAMFPDDVDFATDRDLLGNPRRLDGRVDNGCYETWRVLDNREATNVTTVSTPKNKATDYMENYGGHLYPHPGSVVYIMANANLSLHKNPEATLRMQPGYLLVKDGGSLYGNGNVVEADYVAVEKRVTPEAYELMALPFDCYASNTVTTTYDKTTDALGQTLTQPFSMWSYDGAARMDYRYNFNPTEDGAWNTVASNAKLTANDGWLALYDASAPDTLRFTSWERINAATPYAYVEDGTSTKTVALQQHDDRTSTDGQADFTRMEDMGWNLKGMPWLVNSYATSGDQMHVPHVIYSMNDDGTYRKATGQVYTARSWDTGTSLKLGNAFFTQTAIIGDTEDLEFRLPTSSDAFVAPARQQVAVSDAEGYGDVVEVNPQSDADAMLPYRLGSDGVKWMAFTDAVPQVYINSPSGTQFSLLSQAPVGVDMSMGVRAGRASQLTVSLPSPEAYADYEHVWLTDHEAGLVTDLMEHDYTLSVAPGQTTDNRLTLRIGGMQPNVNCQSNYHIYTRQHRLTITGLSQGDRISIYTVGGALVERTTATATVYHRDLHDGTYIVRVNDMVKKLDARR